MISFPNFIFFKKKKTLLEILIVESTCGVGCGGPRGPCNQDHVLEFIPALFSLVFLPVSCCALGLPKPQVVKAPAVWPASPGGMLTLTHCQGAQTPGKSQARAVEDDIPCLCPRKLVEQYSLWG